MLTPLQFQETENAVRVTNYPQWPGWAFEAEICWGCGTVGAVKAVQPADKRGKVRSPDKKVLTQIRRQIRRQFGDGVEGMIELAAMALPNPVGSRDIRARAQATAIIYNLALAQGFWPRPVIAKVFGIPFKQKYNEQGERVDDETRPSNTVDTLIRQAREQGFLAPPDPERDAPVLWPVGDQAEQQAGSGPLLTLYWTPLTPSRIDSEGEEVADLRVVGFWVDGEQLPDLEPLRDVQLRRRHQWLLPLISKQESLFPDARVRAKPGPSPWQ